MTDQARNRPAMEMLTFGCRLNAYETQIMRDKAREAGLERLEQGAVVVNTCAVTGEAVRQARQAIRKARRDRPLARIIVSGCAAQTEPEKFADMDEVDLVLGNTEKLVAASYRALPEFGVNRFEKVRVDDIMSARGISADTVGSFEGRARAFVQVQNGCDHRCTFCVIPYGRGNSRSLPVEDVIAQVRRFIIGGYREIVLTGVDTTSWGQDLDDKPRLGRLCRAVLEAVPELERLRLSSIDSIEVDHELFDVIANEPRFMPHLHLSLQHGHDIILKRMKRRHSRADSIAFCEKIRNLRPDITFGADLIAGFPTETHDMFRATLDIVEECSLTQLHVFPFSPRPLTPAARMPQLEREIVRERAAQLRLAGDARLESHLESLAGRRVRVLIERKATGRSEDNTQVRLTSPQPPGRIVTGRINGNDGRIAFAETRDTRQAAAAV